VGRATERALLEARIPAGGVAIEIAGPGGSGKTRLIEEAATVVDASGYMRFQAVCSPYGGTAPYSLVRSLLRNGLGVDMHLDDDSTGELLTKVVQQFAPHLRSMVPLIAEAVGANVAPTPEFQALAPENRRDRLHEAVVSFLADAFDRPVALIAEDVHWIDDASRDLLSHVAERAVERKWVVVATRRPEGTPVLTADVDPTAGSQTGEGAAAEASQVAITLTPMDDEAMRAIVLGNARSALSDHQVQTVLERAAGNPLFAVELARIVTTGSADHLPDSVEKIVSARLDRLPPEARRFLRIASVVGVEMDQADLLSILAAEAPGLTPPWEDVAEFFAARPDGRAAFTNIVSHDASYEGLPFGTRRRIHRAVGEHLESKDNPDKLAPLLALHFGEGRDHRRTWRYGKLAGSLAAADQANVEAAANYGRALASARYVRRLPSSDIVDVAMRLGDAQLVLGRFDEARTAWQYARKKNTSLATELAIMRSFGEVESKQGNMAAALTWYSRAQRKFTEPPSKSSDSAPGEQQALALEAARLELAFAAVHVRRAEFHETATTARKALVHIESAGGDPVGDIAAMALDRLQISVNNLREPDVEDFGERALAAYLDLGDHAGAARVLNNMGVGAYFRGEWNAAAEHYTRSVSEGLKAGAVVDGIVGSLNAGEVLSDQGRWVEAREQLESALRNWESAGYAVGIAAARLFLAVVERREGNWRAARELLTNAMARIEEVGVDELLADARTRLLEVDLYEGRPYLARLDQELEDLGADHPLAPRVRRLRGVALHLHGDSPGGLFELEAVLAQSQGFERLLTLRALLHVDPDGADAASHRSEADEIANRLGVVTIAPLPTRLR